MSNLYNPFRYLLEPESHRECFNMFDVERIHNGEVA
jgi:hypothetical protein